MKEMYSLAMILSICIIAGSCNDTADRARNNEVEEERPNIILILADDLGYSDLSCYGSEIQTPNLDRLAEKGIRFTQFYNAARCCPTRASLLTGLYPHQAGMGAMVNDPNKVEEGPYQGYLSKNSVTIAEVLKESNYYTTASGKWHVGETRPHWPIDRGFDNYYGLISGAANYFDITKGKAEGTKRVFAMDSTAFVPEDEVFYMTNAISENAIKFLKKAEGKDQPFFLYLAYTAPHWPLHALQEDIELYEGKYMEGWDQLRSDRFKRMRELGIVDEDWSLSDRNEDVSEWDALDDEQKKKMDLLMSIYAAQVHRLDVGIGQVLEQLRSMGAEENTIVIFLSDNGGSGEYDQFGTDFWGNFWDGTVTPGSVESYHSYGSSWANLSNTPFKYYKKDTYEGGIATPLIVSWPEKISEKGGISHAPGHINDIMATICDVTGAEYPEVYNGNKIHPMEGRSFGSILEGSNEDISKMLFWEHNENRAMRNGDWKLVARKGRPWELYDLAKDRTETINVIESNREVADEMVRAYTSWARDVGVKEIADN